MKPTKIYVFLSCFMFLLSCSFANHKVEKRYNASVNDASVSSIYDGLYRSQNNRILNTYSSVYFSNLHENFGSNSHGTCSYVAIGMMLSFYDTYWDDGFIPESFEKTVTVDFNSMTNSEIVLGCNLESPGIMPEPQNELNNLSQSDYQEYITNNSDNYFQCFLINLSINLFGDDYYSGNSGYGMSLYQQRTLLYYYLVYMSGLSTNVFTMDVMDSSFYNEDDILESAIENIRNGDPVMLNLESSYFGGHTVIAYDCDEENVYVHTGWKTDDGRAITHISLDELGIVAIDSSISIKMTNTFNEPANYLTDEGTPVSVRNFSYPSNVKVPYRTYRDVEPEFSWDSVQDLRWFGGNDILYELEFGDSDTNFPFSFSVVNQNVFVLDAVSWNSIIESPGFDTYYFKITMRVAGQGNARITHSVCLQFTRPMAETNIHTVSSNGYGFGDSYPTDQTTKEVFADTTLSDGFHFKTRRYRTGYIHDECVVLSPKRRGIKEAFLEFQFMKGISRIDLEMSHWREFSNEGLNNETGDFEIQEFRGRKYKTLVDLLSNDVDLPHDRNNKKVVKVFFDSPTFRIRVYAKMLEDSFNDNNRGRVCIGKVTIFETDEECLPLNGWELDFNDNLWNNTYIRPNHDCYSYALNYYLPKIYFEDGREMDPCFSPGQYTSERYDAIREGGGDNGQLSDYFNLNTLSEMASSDATSSFLRPGGYRLREIGKYELCDEGCYKIALVLDTNPFSPDYHWYRQNSDGYWSHKLAGDSATCYDASGRMIIDPQTCDKNHSPVHDYSDGDTNIKFFSVEPPYVYEDVQA